MEMIMMTQERPALRPEIASQIAEFERQVKSIKEKEEALKKAILDEMEASGVVKLDTEELTITYIPPTDRERFDAKTFREDSPRLYDRYVSFIPVKASIRIRVK